LVGNIAWQLAAVYFLEYVVSVGFAAKANPKCTVDDVSCDWWHRNFYEILAFCYQFGVLISRSSISFLRIERIWTLTLLQAINFAFWMIHALHAFIPLWLQVRFCFNQVFINFQRSFELCLRTPFPHQFLWMVFVGLIGGAMYVNSFYNLMVDPNIPDQSREMCINVVSLWVNFGIVTSAVFEIIADKTFLK
jgi:battenin